MDKKFADNQEIHKCYLDTISYVYQSEAYLSQQEFKCKLEQAFLLGMKSSNVEMRQVFYDLFNRNIMTNDLYERLCFIIVTQNWELFGTYYWIRQCIQLTLGSCYNLSYLNNLKPRFLSLVEAQNLANLSQFEHDVDLVKMVDDLSSDSDSLFFIAPIELDIDYSKKGKLYFISPGLSF